MKTLEKYSFFDPSDINLYRIEVSDKELRAFNFFWIGFVIYTAAYTLFSVLPYELVLNKVQFVGLLFILFGATSLVQFKIENKYLAGVYIFYCGWLCFTIYRGFQFDRQFLFDAFFNAWYGILPYFVPTILLFPKNIYYLKKIFTVIVILGILFIAYSLYYWGELKDPSDNLTSQQMMEIFSKTLSIPCGFLVITYIYHSNSRKAFAFFVIGLALLLALIRGRRAIMFMNICYLLIFYVIYLSRNKVKFSTVVLSLFLAAAMLLAGLKFYNAHKTGTFSLIAGRLTEDTRSAVEDCFYDDMNTMDWVVGKGMMGEYYCPGVDDATIENGYTDYRSMIETDYLNIILKGGLINLVLLLLITLPAVFKGLFYSRNILSKAAAVWILLWIIDLYPATVHTFTLNYLLVWIGVGICYSKRIRSMPENAVKEIFATRI